MIDLSAVFMAILTIGMVSMAGSGYANHRAARRRRELRDRWDPFDTDTNLPLAPHERLERRAMAIENDEQIDRWERRGAYLFGIGAGSLAVILATLLIVAALAAVGVEVGVVA